MKQRAVCAERGRLAAERLEVAKQPLAGVLHGDVGPRRPRLLGLDQLAQGSLRLGSGEALAAPRARLGPIRRLTW